MDMNECLKAEYERELRTTRKMLDAIPEEADFEWKANEKNMTLGRLAAHVAETSGIWAIHTLAHDGLKFDEFNSKPWRPASKAEILEKFDQDTTQGKELLANLDPAKWGETCKLTSGDQVWISDTRYNVFRIWVMNHQIHHRAQLGRDLRAMGASIPGSYGPSADAN